MFATKFVHLQYYLTIKIPIEMELINSINYTEETPKYSGSSFFSDIGGHAGLVLGIRWRSTELESFLSVLNQVRLVFDIVSN